MFPDDDECMAIGGKAPLSHKYTPCIIRGKNTVKYDVIKCNEKLTRFKCCYLLDVNDQQRQTRS